MAPAQHDMSKPNNLCDLPGQILLIIVSNLDPVIHKRTYKSLRFTSKKIKTVTDAECNALLTIKKDFADVKDLCFKEEGWSASKDWLPAIRKRVNTLSHLDTVVHCANELIQGSPVLGFDINIRSTPTLHEARLDGDLVYMNHALRPLLHPHTQRLLTIAAAAIEVMHHSSKVQRMGIMTWIESMSGPEVLMFRFFTTMVTGLTCTLMPYDLSLKEFQTIEQMIIGEGVDAALSFGGPPEANPRGGVRFYRGKNWTGKADFKKRVDQLMASDKELGIGELLEGRIMQNKVLDRAKILGLFNLIIGRKLCEHYHDRSWLANMEYYDLEGMVRLLLEEDARRPRPVFR